MHSQFVLMQIYATLFAVITVVVAFMLSLEQRDSEFRVLGYCYTAGLAVIQILFILQVWSFVPA